MGATLAARPYARRGISIGDRTIRVILVDDHAMVREGLRLLLRTAPDIAVVGEASDGLSALTLARQVAPDIVVLDLDMPGGDGTAALHEMGKASPQARVLILTVHAEQERLLGVLDGGARGYLTKEAASRDLLEAIRVVAAGDVYVRPAAARLLAAAVAPGVGPMSPSRTVVSSGSARSPRTRPRSSTPPARSSRPASSTSTPTTTPRRSGTPRSARRRCTASPP